MKRSIFVLAILCLCSGYPQSNLRKRSVGNEYENILIKGAIEKFSRDISKSNLENQMNNLSSLVSNQIVDPKENTSSNSTEQPTTISSTQPTTISSTQPTTTSSTQPTTISSTQPTTTSSAQPTTPSSAQPTTSSPTTATPTTTARPTTPSSAQPTTPSSAQPTTSSPTTATPTTTARPTTAKPGGGAVNLSSASLSTLVILLLGQLTFKNILFK